MVTAEGFVRAYLLGRLDLERLAKDVSAEPDDLARSRSVEAEQRRELAHLLFRQKVFLQDCEFKKVTRRGHRCGVVC